MQSGFALIEMLMTMMIVTALIPITILCIRPFNGALQFDEEIQDQIALSQMRRIILLSYDLQCSPQQLDFIYQRKHCTLSFKNNHLILSPGTQIFISEIEDAYFKEEYNCIYIIYEREGKEYEKVLGSIS
jgi:prepilin-type N-terminal cleavage/methylation domain-containing protein